MNVEIKALSPIHIGAGDEQKWKANLDYVVHQDKVHVIDQEKLERLLSKDEQLQESFIQQVVNLTDNNRTNFDLYRFITNALQVPIEEVSHRILPILKANIADFNTRTLDIQGCMKTPGSQAYIPGSTLKGCFKTALLYHFLTEDTTGKRFFSILMNDLKGACKSGDRFKMRKLQKEIEEKLQRFVRFDFPKGSFLVGDSNPFEKEANAVFEVSRFNLTDLQKSVISFRLECIRQGFSSTFPVQTVGFSTQQLKEAILCFGEASTALIDDEVYEHGADIKEVDEVIADFDGKYEALKNGQALIRIGGGKGYFYNAISAAIRLKDKSLFIDMINALKIIRKGVLKENVLFPKTMNLTNAKMQPMGWASLTFE